MKQTGPFATLRKRKQRPLKDRLHDMSQRACKKMNPNGTPLGKIIEDKKARVAAYRAERAAREKKIDPLDNLEAAIMLGKGDYCP